MSVLSLGNRVYSSQQQAYKVWFDRSMTRHDHERVARATVPIHVVVSRRGRSFEAGGLKDSSDLCELPAVRRASHPIDKRLPGHSYLPSEGPRASTCKGMLHTLRPST